MSTHPNALTTGNGLRDALDGRWARTRREVRRACDEYELRDPDPEWTTEQQREHVLRQLRVLAGTGIQRLGFPEQAGGSGQAGAAIMSFEALGGNLPLMVKAGVQWGLFGGAVQLLGTEHHRERYLRDIVDLDLLGCFAMTETGHGSDVQRLRTTASYDPGTEEFVVHTPHESARKDYIGNAARDGRMAVVFAQLVTGGTGYGVHAFLVPIRDGGGDPLPGVSIEDCGPKGGLNGVDNGRLSFDHVRVERAALLNRFGDVAPDGTYSSPIESSGKRFFTTVGTLVRGRVTVAGAAASAAKTALTIAVRYAEQRRQFERPGADREVLLLDYVAHQRKLLPALARSVALHFAQEELVSTLEQERGGDETGERAQRELESRAAGIKALSTWHATRTIQTCREACGGAGYLAENRLTRLRADSDVFTTFEGDNTVLLQQVAKELLTAFRGQVAELGTLGMARFVAEEFVGAVIERTAAGSLIKRLISSASGSGQEADLSERGGQLALFQDREEHVLEGLARRLRKVSSGSTDQDPFEVFNAAQDHVLHAAKAHVERVILDGFVAGIDRCEDPETARLLGRVCDLHVFSTVEEDIGWFIGHGRISRERARRLPAMVNAACQELRPHARELVEAFGIPEVSVDAPIARGDEQRRQDVQHAHESG